MDNDGSHPVSLECLSYERLLPAEEGQLLESGKRESHGVCTDVCCKYKEIRGYMHEPGLFGSG